jgi:putative two-component system response regulator
MTSVSENSSATGKGRILAVDDTPESLKLLTDILTEEGYQVRSAINGELAFYSAVAKPPELVLLDIRMPGIDGFEVCRRFKAHPKICETPIIFVSASSDTDDKVLGFGLGAVDFVAKPFQQAELLARVRTHLELGRLRNTLEALVNERTEELLKSENKLRATLVDFVASIAATIEMRDPYTAGHQRRVASLAVAIARKMGFPEDKVESIGLASLVHDCGKLRVPTEILCNPGRLSEIESKFVQMHPEIGYEILKTIDFPWPLAQMVLQHHERPDGSGYPHGLKAGQILPEASVISVADVAEAMISHRPYRAALGLELAMAEIKAGRGTHFAPDAADACLQLLSEHGISLLTRGVELTGRAG